MSFEAVCLKAMPSPSFQPEENVFPGMEPLWIADESQQRVPIIKTPAWVQRMVSLLSFPWADRSASGSDACDFPKCSQPEGSGVILPVFVCSWIRVSHGCAWQQAQESALPPWCEAGVTSWSSPVSGGLPGGWPRALLPELLLPRIRCCCRAGHLSLYII